MLTAILIATFFSFGFFIESVIGFGGGIIAYSLLGFFINIKSIVIVGLYVGTCSSSYIAYTDFKSFNKKIFFQIIPLCLIGTIIGVIIFSKVNSKILSLILGFLLILLTVKIIFFDKKILPKILKNKLLLIGGISHGAFGLGGPFIVNAINDNFKNKSEMRTTMAVFFVFFNIIRIVQLSLGNQIDFQLLSEIWWIMIPIAFSIYLGFKVHLKISEKLVKKMIAILTVLGGIKFISIGFE